MYEPNPREEGSALLFILLCLMGVLALAAAANSATMTNQRATSESSRVMRAFYLADTGAQLGAFQIRASNGTLAATTITESLSGGQVVVDIDPLTPTLYRVLSTADFQTEQSAVEMHIETMPTFEMEGALQVNFGDGVEVQPTTIDFELNGAATLTGEDHDALGNLLADQSEATFGVALAPVPGNPTLDIYVDVANGAELSGSPTATSNTVAEQSELITNLVSYAQTNADVTVVGGMTIGNSDTGNFGTAANPVLTYVSLGDNEQFLVRQNFEGWGTLVVEVDRATSQQPLYFRDSVKWHGLVVVRFKGEAEIPGDSLIEFDNHGQVIGGLVVDFAAEGTAFTGSGDVFDAGTGNAGVYYSSDVLSSANGIDQVVDHSVRVMSYRHVQP